jgi:ankyrin repeat protein
MHMHLALQVSKDGQTPLHAAAEAGSSAVLQVLMAEAVEQMVSQVLLQQWN